jgi:hypothetical protein
MPENSAAKAEPVANAGPSANAIEPEMIHLFQDFAQGFIIAVSPTKRRKSNRTGYVHPKKYGSTGALGAEDPL